MRNENSNVESNNTQYSLLNKLQERHPFPLTCQIIVTEECPLKCSHCFIVNKVDPKNRLSLAEYETFFDELVELGVFQLIISGGEPTLRDDLLKMIAAAGTRHFYVRLKTSGILLSKKKIRNFFDAGLSQIDVSLYHTEPEKHDSFVGVQGAFQKAFEALLFFKAKGGRVSISFMAMEWNHDVVVDMIRLCEAHDFTCSIDPNIVLKQDGDRSPSTLRMTDESLVRFMSERMSIKELVYDCEVQMKSPSSPVCSMGISSAQINPNGDVVLCDRLPWVIGNIRDNRFEEIWLNSPIRKKLLKLTWADMEQCAQCDLASLCARCPGASLREIGDIRKATPFDCAITKAKAKAYYANRD